MLKFFGRQWQGEAPFWVSVLLVSLVLPWALIIAGTQAARDAAHYAQPHSKKSNAAVSR